MEAGLTCDLGGTPALPARQGEKQVNGIDDERGLVFHIIHGSFVDGYGTRTTVFLKGCPLRCLWCCNPEGQKKHPELKVNASLCNACGNCVAVCPESAICIGPESALQTDRAKCTNCGVCLGVCYTGALDLFGRIYTIGELFEEVANDEQYYRASGGGVTIGGGEPTCQSRFTLQLLRMCRENLIHTALDTCGYIVEDEGIRALEEADLVLFDLKCMDPHDHVKSTGVSNQVILENLKRRDATQKPIIVRVPLIPGYTDSRANLSAIAGVLADLKSLDRIDLLPLHQYGKIKYAQLGMEYPLSKIQPPSGERIAQIQAFFESFGLKTQIGG